MAVAACFVFEEEKSEMHCTVDVFPLWVFALFSFFPEGISNTLLGCCDAASRHTPPRRRRRRKLRLLWEWCPRTWVIRASRPIHCDIARKRDLATHPPMRSKSQDRRGAAPRICGSAFSVPLRRPGSRVAVWGEGDESGFELASGACLSSCRSRWWSHHSSTFGKVPSAICRRVPHIHANFEALWRLLLR